MTFYHVDRLRLLHTNQIIELMSPNIPDNNPYHLKTIKEIYNNKFSAHGFRYAIFAAKNLANQSLEQILELVRLYEFPDKISRFQSVFAFDNLESAYAFSKGEHPIYEVEPCSTKDIHIGDMNLLKGCTICSCLEISRLYWKSHLGENFVKEILLPPPIRVGNPVLIVP